MSGQTAVWLREVQGIYQGLAPWAVKDSPSPISQENRMFEHAVQGPGRPNNCAMVHKDVVHNWLDNRTLRIGFVVQPKILYVYQMGLIN